MRKSTGVRLFVLLVMLAASFLAGGATGQADNGCCACGPQWCQSQCDSQCGGDPACYGACDTQCWEWYNMCINTCPYPIC